MKTGYLFVLIFLLYQNLALANKDIRCELVFDKNYASYFLNKTLSEKYPALHFAISDVDQFISKMKNRFELQKKINPNNPHSFDYSELGMPLIKDIQISLSKKIEFLQKIKQRIISNRNKHSVSGYLKNKFEKYKYDEITTAIDFYNELLNESSTYTQNNTITYQQLIEFTYFYSRAIGNFDTKEFSFFSRYTLHIDRYLNGYRQLSIADEYNMYKARDFRVFQIQKAAKGFMLAAKPFEDAFKNKDNLDTVWIPTNAWVERDIFMRLMGKNVHLIGVTPEPIQADGFLRPGGDFNMHDVRHESDKYHRRMHYIEQNGLSEKQISDFERKSEDWWIELDSEISKIQDPLLKEATELMVFNFHHDRGFPLMPSVYLSHKRDNVIYGLYTMLRLAGEPIQFKNPKKYFDLSHQWLTEFWKKRQQEEFDIILQSENP